MTDFEERWAAFREGWEAGAHEMRLAILATLGDLTEEVDSLRLEPPKDPSGAEV